MVIKFFMKNVLEKHDTMLKEQFMINFEILYKIKRKNWAVRLRLVDSFRSFWSLFLFKKKNKMCLAQNTFWHLFWSVFKFTILTSVENVVENGFKVC